MKKRFRDTEVWKWIRTLLEFGLLVLIILAVMAVYSWVVESIHAEEGTRWVICQPDDVVMIREGPKKSRTATGELEPCEAVRTDGKTRNGFTHLIDMANESGDGWARSIYLVDEEPEVINRTARVVCKGRLAARRCIGGERVRWLKSGQEVMVYYRTSEWCVTEYGYVMTMYLRVDGE